MTTDFTDLTTANAAYAETFHRSGLPGAAAAGVAVVTCMDSRIDPLAMLGMSLGDAKVVRNPGGRVTDDALQALVLAVHLLGVDRVLVVPHTRCAVASNTTAALRSRIAESAGAPVDWLSLPGVDDQEADLRADVERVRTHPLVPDHVTVGGFVYDVDTGRLRQVV